eukprot:1280162-Rhodomonas_salina.1
MRARAARSVQSVSTTGVCVRAAASGVDAVADGWRGGGRAAAWLQLRESGAAERDCDEVLALEPAN